jgi:hypothetical protein
MSAVELNNSLYDAVGGYADYDLDTVQELSLDSLTWKLKLPQAACYFPCLKTPKCTW